MKPMKSRLRDCHLYGFYNYSTSCLKEMLWSPKQTIMDLLGFHMGL